MPIRARAARKLSSASMPVAGSVAHAVLLPVLALALVLAPRWAICETRVPGAHDSARVRSGGLPLFVRHRRAETKQCTTSAYRCLKTEKFVCDTYKCGIVACDYKFGDFQPMCPKMCNRYCERCAKSEKLKQACTFGDCGKASNGNPKCVCNSASLSMTYSLPVCFSFGPRRPRARALMCCCVHLV